MYMDSIMNNAINVTPENFQQVILQDSQIQVVMVEFWAAGYEPSHQSAPVFVTVAAKLSRTLIHARVDCHQQLAIAGQFCLQHLPPALLVN